MNLPTPNRHDVSRRPAFLAETQNFINAWKFTDYTYV